MLLVKTRVGPSPIHGIGVFACERVDVGEPVWRFAPGFDQQISDEQRDALPAAFQDFLDMYAYRSSDLEGVTILSCDHARFLNHSDTPNTEERPFESIACKTIEVGDEITCDYEAFCSDGKGFEP